MKASKVMINFLFPPRCAICDKVIDVKGPHICDKCRPFLSKLEEPRCYKCGNELSQEEDEYCRGCLENERSYIKGFPVYKYKPPLQDSLMAFKYLGKQENAEFYAEEIYAEYGKTFRELGIQALIPVPIHRRKYITRGYNQAGLIAAELGKKLGIPVLEELLTRDTYTEPQKNLNHEKREHNLKGAFSANTRVLEKIKVPEIALLVDDIYTTGATIQICTKVCMEIGIQKVYYTSVACGSGA